MRPDFKDVIVEVAEEDDYLSFSLESLRHHVEKGTAPVGISVEEVRVVYSYLMDRILEGQFSVREDAVYIKGKT